MPALRVLSRSNRQALPHGREDRGSSYLLRPALARRRQKDSPCGWLAGNLDAAPLPLHPPRPLDEISPRDDRSVCGEFFPRSARVKLAGPMEDVVCSLAVWTPTTCTLCRRHPERISGTSKIFRLA